MEKPRSLITKTNEKLSYANTATKLINPELLRPDFEREYSFALQKEIPKDETEIKVIEATNKILDEKAGKYINTTFPIYANNVHKIPHEVLSEGFGKGSGAIYIPNMHEIFFSDALPQPLFLDSINHEMSHAKSYNLFQSLYEKSGREIQIYRSGVCFVSRDGKYIYLENLNEAITETIAKEITENFYKKTGLDKKLDALVSTYNNLYAGGSNPLLNRFEVLTFLRDKDTPVPLPVEFSYNIHREFLQTLQDDILIKNKESFSNLEEVKELFLEAYFTGEFRKLYKIIDKTYGKGTFKNITRIDCKKIGTPQDAIRTANKLNSYILELKQSNATKN